MTRITSRFIALQKRLCKYLAALSMFWTWLSGIAIVVLLILYEVEAAGFVLVCGVFASAFAIGMTRGGGVLALPDEVWDAGDKIVVRRDGDEVVIPITAFSDVIYSPQNPSMLKLILTEPVKSYEHEVEVLLPHRWLALRPPRILKELRERIGSPSEEEARRQRKSDRISQAVFLGEAVWLVVIIAAVAAIISFQWLGLVIGVVLAVFAVVGILLRWGPIVGSSALGMAFTTMLPLADHSTAMSLVARVAVAAALGAMVGVLIEGVQFLLRNWGEGSDDIQAKPIVHQRDSRLR